MNDFNYIKVHKVEEGIEQVAKHQNSKFIAGGTNVIDLYKYNVQNPDLLIDINGIDGYKSIEKLENGGIRIGALMTNSDTASHQLVEKHYPLLNRAILAGASGQIRNLATNGGNLLQRTRCYYFYDQHAPCNKRQPGSGCSALNGYNRIHAILGANENCIAVFPSDMCVALSALDAKINVVGIDGKRTIDFKDFHRLPGDNPSIDNNLKNDELIVSIDLPANGYEKNYSYLKLRDRHSYAFALVSVASGLDLDGSIIKSARLALGGVAHKPWRILEAEDFLKGKEAIDSNFEKAAKLVLDGAKGYEHNKFKIELAKRAIVRNFNMALTPESQRPGALPSL